MRFLSNVLIQCFVVMCAGCYDEEHAVQVHHTRPPAIRLPYGSAVLVAPAADPTGACLTALVEERMGCRYTVLDHHKIPPMDVDDVLSLVTDARHEGADALVYAHIVDLDLNPAYAWEEQRFDGKTRTRYQRTLHLTLKATLKALSTRTSQVLGATTLDGSQTFPPVSVWRDGPPCRDPHAVEALFEAIQPSDCIHAGLTKLADQWQSQFETSRADGAVILFGERRDVQAQQAIAAARAGDWQRAMIVYQQRVRDADRHGKIEVRARAHYNLAVAYLYGGAPHWAVTAELRLARGLTQTARLHQLVDEQLDQLAATDAFAVGSGPVPNLMGAMSPQR